MVIRQNYKRLLSRAELRSLVCVTENYSLGGFLKQFAVTSLWMTITKSRERVLSTVAVLL